MTPSLELKLAKIVHWCDKYVDCDVDVSDPEDYENTMEELAGMVDDPEVREFLDSHIEDETIPARGRFQ
jgi:hypothetical protein